MARNIELARVFFRLNAETQGLERDLAKSEKQLDKFVKYVRANPVAAAGALGVAIVAIGAKAVQMAEEVDRAFRKLGAVVPGLNDNLKVAQQGVAALAKETGRTQQELLATAQQIAAEGVDGTTDLLNRLRIVTNLAKVTGTETGTIAAGLDQVLDVFGIASEKADEAGARLFAIAKGRAPLDALFAAIQGAAPGIREAGLSFEVAAQALGNLLAEGRSPKQAASQLKELAGQGAAGRAELERLAGAAMDGAAAIRELDSAVTTINNSSTERLARARQELNNLSIDIGKQLEGPWAAVLEYATKYVNLLRQMRGLTVRPPTGEPDPGINGPNPNAPFGTGPPPPTALTPDQLKAIEEQKALALKTFNELTAELAKRTATAVDDSLLETQRFIDEMDARLAKMTEEQRAKLRPLVDELVEGMRAATQLLRDAETLTVSVSPLPRSRPGSPLRQGSDTAKEQEDAWKAGQKAVEEYERKQREAIQNAQLHTQAIESSARAALQLGNAFGLVGDQAAQAAEAAVQIAANIKQIADLNKAGALDLTSLTGGLSSVLSIAGGIASLVSGLFGESPEDKRRREVQQANTEAILELSRQVGQFGGRLAGTAASKVLGVQSAVTAGFTGGGPFGVFSRMQAELGKLGLTMGDLRDVASSLGISFANATPSVSELRALLDAIAANQLATRSGSFGGQLEQLLDEFEAFDITDPLDQLRQLVDLFDNPKFGSPALRKALAGLDLSTPEGRAAADKAIQELVKRLGLAPDQGGITLAELGGLSPEEFRQALLDLERRLDELGQAGPPQGEVNQFAVQRTITEAQANLLASLLTTDSYWNEQTARNTAAIAAAMGAAIPQGTLAPPPVGRSLGAGGVTIDTIEVTVSLPAGTDLSTGQAVGSAVAAGMAAQLDALLGQRLRVRKLLSGNVVQV